MDSGDQLDHGQEGGQVGSLLEAKRREKGLSLKDVEQATKIRTRYLEGLEREDYSVLPDPIYARGFLKTYANFLGLDGEQLSRELKDLRAPRRERQFSYQGPETSEFEQPLISPGRIGSADRWRISGTTILTVVLAVLVLAVVIGVLYSIGRQSAENSATQEPARQEEEQPVEEEPAANQTNSGAKERAANESAGKPAPKTVRATVRVLDFPAGMTIQTDGRVAYDQVAQPGFSQTFEAQGLLTVSTGNAGAVEVEVDGQNLGRLGFYGQPVTREFTPNPEG